MKKLLEINTERLRRECWGNGEQLAQRLGITKTSFSRKLNGHQPLLMEELNQIAVFLNRSTRYFLREIPLELGTSSPPAVAIQDPMKRGHKDSDGNGQRRRRKARGAAVAKTESKPLAEKPRPTRSLSKGERPLPSVQNRSDGQRIAVGV